MGQNEENCRVERALSLAAQALSTGRGDLAHTHLRDAWLELDGSPDSKLLAEYHMLTGDVLALKPDSPPQVEGAQSHYESALATLDRLAVEGTAQRMLVLEHLGTVLHQQRRLSRARFLFQKAIKIAISEKLCEDSARIELRLILVEMQCDQDPLLQHWAAFRRVGKRVQVNSQVQLAAWHQHAGEIKEKQRGRSFARASNPPADTYFESLFESIRLTSR